MTEPVVAGHGFFARGAAIGCMLLGAMALIGCTTDRDKGLCPTAFVLAPTSSLTVFRVGAPADPSGELYTVWMGNVRTSCDFDKTKYVTDSSLRIAFHAKRAPSMEAAAYNVPYFVAVTHHGDRIMAKQIFTAQIVFGPGQVTSDFQQSIDSTVIHLARGKKVGEYAIVTGLQLTKSQLDYNTKMNRYAP
ncbi:MAG: hypothetical protein JO261_06130 [Alphaproteobacteria bacterium]|nr:hypothetical protein [Alphaproteobacteria bacterium]MBV9693261.1 hypothetical protein [Alphaproteobacteria bacterium]